MLVDASHFDRLARTVAGRLTRRAALGAGGAGIVATALDALGRRATAQDATPATSPAAGREPVSLLFVQSFARGSLVPKAGEAGSYTLTLAEEQGPTIYFSDRPNRLVGTLPTERFFAARGISPFDPADPPNAALVARTEAGEDVVVVELLDPRYDAATRTVTYDVRVLADDAGEALASLAARQQDAQFAETFGAASLFIDAQPACQPQTISCWDESGAEGVMVGTLSAQADYCYPVDCCFGCGPCDGFAPLLQACLNQYPNCGNCRACDDGGQCSSFS